MLLDTNMLINRLKEAFGDDSQKEVGEKLNMTQGNVSKILSGQQQPQLDTIYHVAEAYDVSVDWLLGLTDDKRLHRYQEGVTYTTAVNNLHELVRHEAVKIEETGSKITLELKDQLIKMLLKKSVSLYKTDNELFESWTKTKLVLFEDKSIIWDSTWDEEQLAFLAGEASTEAHWLEVLDAAKKVEDDLADMMGSCDGPFGG